MGYASQEAPASFLLSAACRQLITSINSRYLSSIMMMEANVIFKCQICSEGGFIRRHRSATLAERPAIAKPGHIGRAAVARSSGVGRAERGGGQNQAAQSSKRLQKGHLGVI